MQQVHAISVLNGFVNVKPERQEPGRRRPFDFHERFKPPNYLPQNQQYLSNEVKSCPFLSFKHSLFNT